MSATRHGYTDIRDHIRNTWRYLAVRDADGREVTRIDLFSDPRVLRTWVDATGFYWILITFRSSDGDPASPRFAEASIMSAPVGGEAYTHNAEPERTFNAADDTLLLTLTFRIPEVFI